MLFWKQCRETSCRRRAHAFRGRTQQLSGRHASDFLVERHRDMRKSIAMLRVDLEDAVGFVGVDTSCETTKHADRAEPSDRAAYPSVSIPTLNGVGLWITRESTSAPADARVIPRCYSCGSA